MGEFEFGLGSISWEFSPAAVGVAAAGICCALLLYEQELRYSEGAQKLVPLDAEDIKPLLAPSGALAAAAGAQPPSWASDCMVPALCVAMTLFSLSLVYVNAWVMDDMCPYPATVTGIQQAFGFVAAAFCVCVLRLDEPLEISARAYIAYVAPLALGFAVYLWGGNYAYVYLQPGFIQMLKPVGGPCVFAFSCLAGLEAYTHPKFLNLIFIFGGIAITSSFEGASTSTSVQFAVFALVGAYVAYATYTVATQLLQTAGRLQVRFSPLTIQLYVSPLTVVFMAVIAAATEWNSPDFQCFEKLKWWAMAVDCLIAFGFNLTMMHFVRTLSAVSYTIFALFKDIVLVLTAFLFFKEQIYLTEMVGWTVTMVGAAIWQHRKLREKRLLR